MPQKGAQQDPHGGSVLELGVRERRGGGHGAGGSVPGRWKCCTLLRAELPAWRGVGCGALVGVRLSSHSRMTCG